MPPAGETRAALVLLGFTAAVAQIVLMRELLVLFYGNELSLGLTLACWLLWTAFGSGVLARLPVRNPRTLAGALLAAMAFALPLTIVALRSVNLLLGRVPGEVLGPGAILGTACAVLALFCSLTGWLFAAGSRLYSHQTRGSIGHASSAAYLLDAAGAALGGLLASLVLIRRFNATEIALLLGLLNLLGAVTIALPRKRRTRRALIAAVAAAGVLVLPSTAARLETASLARLWHGFRVIDSRNSLYGNLAVVDTEAARVLLQNGLVVSTTADSSAAEEAVHFALLQHPAPRSLLLIGGGCNGSLAQALQHRTLERVDYVELDPEILSLAHRHFPDAWAPVDADRRVHVHNIDGRLFLKTARQRFNVIIVNLPDPRTAELNRFYTVEFFREAAAKLTPSGVFSFQLSGAENYISPELSEFLRCINKTLRAVFPLVTVLPGEDVHFFATRRAGVLAVDTGEMLARLRERRLATIYVREYYLPFRLSPDRVRDLESQIAPQPATPINHDFAPSAYYFDVVLWSSRFHTGWNGWFARAARVPFATVAGGAFLLLLAVALLVGAARRGSHRAGARGVSAFCVAAMGFTLMALELLLLLAFQALYGYVYHQLAILIAGVMTGMALGTWLAMRRTGAGRHDFRTLATLQMAAAASALVLCVLFAALARVTSAIALSAIAQALFPLLAVSCGLLAGYQFPVASRVFFPSVAADFSPPPADAEPDLPAPSQSEHAGGAGVLYALDLLGACLGALLLSVYLVPVFGFMKTASLVALINLVPAGLALSLASEPRR